MSARVWRRANSVELVKILQPLKRITRRWALRQQRAREKKKAMETNSEAFTHMFVRARLHLFYLFFFLPSSKISSASLFGVCADCCRLKEKAAVLPLIPLRPLDSEKWHEWLRFIQLLHEFH